MMSARKRVLIVAGDPSGDLHAAGMLRRMRVLAPDCEAAAIGGRELEKAGAKLIFNLVDDAVVGFTEVVAHLPRILQAFIAAISVAKRADLVVLVDYPGFNLRLARALHKLANRPKILYFIAPQVWAWHKSRVRLMERIVDRVAVVFPFESTLFSNAEYVGYPLLDLPEPSPEPELLDASGRPAENIVALLPGSRRKEIERHVGIMIGCARILKMRGYRPVISLANPEFLPLFEGADCELYSGDARRLLSASRLAVVKSGTSTMQAALLRVPFVTVYKLSWLSFALGRYLVSTRFIAMPNILLDRAVSPELIQTAADPRRIVDALESLDRAKTIEQFDRLRSILENRGCAESVARLCVDLLGQSA